MRALALITLAVLVELGCSTGSTSTGSSSAGSTTGRHPSSASSSSGGTSTGTVATSGGATSSGGTGGGPSCTPPCGAHASCLFSTLTCECVPGFTDCSAGHDATSCVDEATDSSNCGACGNACPSGSVCSGSTCVCSSGTYCQSDAGALCAQLASDALHCGACNVACSSPATECVDGGCACPGGLALCGGADAGTPQICLDTTQDPQNCGQCEDACETSYAAGSTCSSRVCNCAVPTTVCVALPVVAEPTCACTTPDAGCGAPSFATDIYPLLSQQTGEFGCSASHCHEGSTPQAGLAFLDQGGNMDAGMAYAELLGTVPDAGTFGIPFCDAGLPPKAPSTQCACQSLVIPGSVGSSLMYELLTNTIPPECAHDLQPMPAAVDVFVPISRCSQQLIAQWIETGANP